jgi:hypothetical protein
MKDVFCMDSRVDDRNPKDAMSNLLNSDANNPKIQY